MGISWLWEKSLMSYLSLFCFWASLINIWYFCGFLMSSWLFSKYWIIRSMGEVFGTNFSNCSYFAFLSIRIWFSNLLLIYRFGLTWMFVISGKFVNWELSVTLVFWLCFILLSRTATFLLTLLGSRLKIIEFLLWANIVIYFAFCPLGLLSKPFWFTNVKLGALPWLLIFFRMSKVLMFLIWLFSDIISSPG